MNPSAIMKIMNAKNKFVENHPKFTAFLSAVYSRGIEAGTVIEITVTRPGKNRLHPIYGFSSPIWICFKVSGIWQIEKIFQDIEKLRQPGCLKRTWLPQLFLCYARKHLAFKMFFGVFVNFVPVD